MHFRVSQRNWDTAIPVDITTAVMSMSSFRAAPRSGHLERVRHICGYLSKTRQVVIRLRTDGPDYSDLPDQDYDWMNTVYSGANELLPENASPALRKFVTMTPYVHIGFERPWQQT
jgi:hypothetical protein